MQIFNVMLRPKGAAGYVAAGRLTLDEAPARGVEISLRWAGETIRGRVDRLFIPPGCEEHCIGTLFAAVVDTSESGA